MTQVVAEVQIEALQLAPLRKGCEEWTVMAKFLNL